MRTYYPIIYESSASPMVFEISNKDTLSSKYGSLDLTISKGEHENETAQILKSNYIISTTKDNLTINEKYFCYSGLYKVAGLE